jgi:hypothetical protein
VATLDIDQDETLTTYTVKALKEGQTTLHIWLPEGGEGVPYVSAEIPVNVGKSGVNDVRTVTWKEETMGDPTWNVALNLTFKGKDLQVKFQGPSAEWKDLMLYDIGRPADGSLLAVSGTVVMTPSAASGKKTLSPDSYYNWSYSDPMLVFGVGIVKDFKSSGSSFRFSTTETSAGPMMGVEWRYEQQMFRRENNVWVAGVKEINRVVRGSIGFDIHKGTPIVPAGGPLVPFRRR